MRILLCATLLIVQSVPAPPTKGTDPKANEAQAIRKPKPRVVVAVPRELAEFGETTLDADSEVVRGATIRTGDPQVTLIWDTDVDLDLHVQEPGGSHIYWEQRRGRQGGSMDTDKIKGPGPENVLWSANPPARPPQGTYKWYVHYYGPADGRPVPTRWKVRVKHNKSVWIREGRLEKVGDRSEVHRFEVE